MAIGGKFASNLVYYQAREIRSVGQWSNIMALPPRRPFKLPTSVTIIFRPDPDGKTSAHALDFDIVSTGADELEARDKIRLAIVSYIETGLLNEWTEDILYPAADEFWPAPGAKLEVGDPIHIMSRNLLVYSASSVANEHREANTLA